jgi:hypothetical protein
MAVFNFPEPIIAQVNSHLSEEVFAPLRIDCRNPEINPNPPFCDDCNPPFSIPFTESDNFYFQYLLPTPEIVASISFFDENGAVISSLIQPLTPFLTTGGFIHDVVIVPLPNEVYYIRIIVGSVVHYTPFYCLVECENTVVLEGKYPIKDCEKFNYTGSYRNIIRLEGVLERDGVTIEETTASNNNRVNSKTTENYRLVINQLPPIVIEQIIRIFAAQIIEIDSIEYSFTGEISKNNELNNYWNLDLKLTKTICQTNFNCP